MHGKSSSSSPRAFTSRVRKPVRLATVALVGALVAASCSSGGSSGKGSATSAPAGSAASASRPNIVFILTDDLSWNLVNQQFAPHIMQLERQGATFDHYLDRKSVV